MIVSPASVWPLLFASTTAPAVFFSVMCEVPLTTLDEASVDCTTVPDGLRPWAVALLLYEPESRSVWVIEWGVGKVYLVYPNGYQIGISKEDLGRLTTYDANGRAFMAWVTLFKGSVGLVVEDTRAIQRICNVETAGSTNIITASMLIDAINRLPNRGDGAYIYCNRTIAGYIEKDSIGSAARPMVYTGEGSPWGKGREDNFRGVPIRLCEALVNTEVTLS